MQCPSLTQCVCEINSGFPSNITDILYLYTYFTIFLFGLITFFRDCGKYSRKLTESLLIWNFFQQNTQSIAELERRLTEMQIKNMPGTPVLSQLLISYARNKQVEKAEEVKRVRTEMRHRYCSTNMIYICMCVVYFYFFSLKE